jgi:membrane-associated phospholipid phosphatase
VDGRTTSRAGTWIWLASVTAACAGAVAAVYIVTVRTGFGRAIGDAAFRGADTGETGPSVAVASALDLVTVTTLLATMVVVATVALLRMRRADGLVALGLLVAASVSSRLLKSYLLDRPDLGIVEWSSSGTNSLPSGHTTAAFSIGVALTMVVAPRWRAAVCVSGLVFSCVIAISTMLAGWHRAGDSLASFFLVGMWSGAAGMALLALDRRLVVQSPPAPGAERARSARRSATTWLLMVAASCAVLSVATGVGVALDRDARASGLGATIAFASAALAILAGSSAVSALHLQNVLRVDRTRAPCPP